MPLNSSDAASGPGRTLTASPEPRNNNGSCERELGTREGLGGVRAPSPRSHEPIVYLLHVRMLCPPLPHLEQIRLEPDFFLDLVFFAAMVAISYCYTVALLL